MKTKLLLTIILILIGIVAFVFYFKDDSIRPWLNVESEKSYQDPRILSKNGYVHYVHKEDGSKRKTEKENLVADHSQTIQLPQEIKNTIRILSYPQWDEKHEKSWQMNLEFLRKNADKYVPVIASALRNAPVEDSLSRFQMTFLLGEIGSEEAFTALKNVVDEVIPETLLKSNEMESVPEASYFAVKTQALIAIAEIAKQTDNLDKARDFFVSSLHSPYQSVRRQAVMNLKQLFPQDASVKEVIFSTLPASERYLYNLETRDGPQSMPRGVRS